MSTIALKGYGQVISDSDLGGTILTDIKSALVANHVIDIDFEGVISMATFCSKQIFGSLYVELTPQVFFDRVRLVNVSHDMRTIVRLGIEKALADEKVTHHPVA